MSRSTQPTLHLTCAEPDPLYSSLSIDPKMAHLVELFVDHLPDRAAALREAANEADSDALSDLAYQLKGSAGGYGFDPITELAEAVERQAREQADLDELRRTVDELVDLCSRATADAPPTTPPEFDPLPPAA